MFLQKSGFLTHHSQPQHFPVVFQSRQKNWVLNLGINEWLEQQKVWAVGGKWIIIKSCVHRQWSGVAGRQHSWQECGLNLKHVMTSFMVKREKRISHNCLEIKRRNQVFDRFVSHLVLGNDIHDKHSRKEGARTISILVQDKLLCCTKWFQCHKKRPQNQMTCHQN